MKARVVRPHFRRGTYCLESRNWTLSDFSAAEHEYGPFGEVIRQTGTMAKASPFRFSTRYQDDETDLLYYGYRYYNASAGRWLSRDPIAEGGGLNLYGSVNNDSIRKWDFLGKVQVIFAGGGVLPLRVDVVPSLTVSDVCHGGPLHFNVNFNADYNDEGNRWMDQAGAWFGYGGGRTPNKQLPGLSYALGRCFHKATPGLSNRAAIRVDGIRCRRK